MFEHWLRDELQTRKRLEAGRKPTGIDFAANLKSERDGEIDVAGAELANVLSAAGLVDEYRLYYRLYVLGGGKPTSPVPCLRFA